MDAAVSWARSYTVAPSFVFTSSRFLSRWQAAWARLETATRRAASGLSSQVGAVIVGRVVSNKAQVKPCPPASSPCTVAPRMPHAQPWTWDRMASL